MLALVIDTATPAVTVGLVDVADEQVVVVDRAVEVAANRHGELLAPLVERMLAAARAHGPVRAVVVGRGPGPFTGLRIGIVTAAAVGHALGVPVHGVDSLAALHASQPEELRHRPGGLAVATDARRRQVYWAAHTDTERRGPDIATPTEVVGRLADLGVTAVAGAGVQAHAEVLGPLAAAGGVDYPTPVALAGLAADAVRSGGPGGDVSPLYLRRPDAVPPERLKRVTPA